MIRVIPEPPGEETLLLRWDERRENGVIIRSRHRFSMTRREAFSLLNQLRKHLRSTGLPHETYRIRPSMKRKKPFFLIYRPLREAGIAHALDKSKGSDVLFLCGLRGYEPDYVVSSALKRRLCTVCMKKAARRFR